MAMERRLFGKATQKQRDNGESWDASETNPSVGWPTWIETTRIDRQHISDSRYEHDRQAKERSNSIQRTDYAYGDSTRSKVGLNSRLDEINRVRTAALAHDGPTRYEDLIVSQHLSNPEILYHFPIERIINNPKLHTQKKKRQKIQIRLSDSREKRRERFDVLCRFLLLRVSDPVSTPAAL